MFDYFEIHGPVSISFIYRGLYWDGRDYFMTLKLCRIYIYSDCKYVNTYIETRHFWNMYIYKYIYIYVFITIHVNIHVNHVTQVTLFLIGFWRFEGQPDLEK